MIRRMLLPGIAAAVVICAGAASAQWGGGGWWDRVTPTTPEQKAYVEQARQIHAQLWQKQSELRALQSQPKPSEAAIRAKQAEVDALRGKLQEWNLKNRAVMQQLAPRAGRTAGAGPCGLGLGPCGGVPGSACPNGRMGGRGGRGGGRGACWR